MTYNNVYYFDVVRSMLWILPPKNASSSIKACLNLSRWIGREEALSLNHHFTVGVVRHPFERVVSGLYEVEWEPIPFTQRLMKHLHSSIIRPQAPAFEGLRIDTWLHVERLRDEWKILREMKVLPALLNLNTGVRANGRPASWHNACDWSEFMPLYQRDFDLCSDYQRP